VAEPPAVHLASLVVEGSGETVGGTVAPLLDHEEEVYAALRTGLRDYVDKNGFEQVVIALSGGIDSALVALVAVDALGPERVTCVSMPSPYSSEGTRADARAIAENLGVDFREIAIADAMEAYDSMLAGEFAGREPDIAEENIQARIRGNVVMALSNKFGWLVLATGNKSELSVGYATLYGDMAGELRHEQLDEDSLPPYEILDAILTGYVEEDLDAVELVRRGLPADEVERVIRMVDRAEYKRRQAPPGIKVSTKAFGRDRRLPITNRFEARAEAQPRRLRALR
jgi:NAD+ synthase (glutamine-hydrolysing)